MTPHNRAERKDIAKRVLLPGDPARATFVSDEFLTDARLVTDVRGIKGYTGTYKGMDVTVMASGMGGASAGIYSYELYKFYDVDAIVRIGTSGGLQKELIPGDLVLAMSASTDSGWAHQYGLNGTLSPTPDFTLFRNAVKCADSLGVRYTAGMVFSSDMFSSYNALGEDEGKRWASMGALVQDMETYALYSTAMYLKKRALSILTMTDNCVTGESFEDSRRMKGNSNMIRLALETLLEDCHE
ncbi:MAG: purine-nucleoside phosphorylase [Bullifex sp.]